MLAAFHGHWGSVFSLKRKGDFRLQLTRTLKQPDGTRSKLYLFTPHESNLSAWTLSEEQFSLLP